MAETSDVVNKLAPQIDDSKLEKPPEETNWNNLPPEMKVMVIKEMDYLTRLRFEQCSKESKRLSELKPYYIKGLVSYGQPEGYKNRYRDVEYKGPVYIDGRKIGRPVVEEDFYRKFLMANVRMKEFRVPMIFPEVLIDSNKIKAETAYLDSKDADNCEKWLNHLASGVENLIISFSQTDSTADHPNVINAKKLQMSCISVNTDQLLKFKARKLQLESSDVPIPGVIQLIQKWIQEDYPIGSELFVSEDYVVDLEYQTEYCLKNAGLQYSKKTRTFGKKTEIRIEMKPGKYMEISPWLKDGFFFLSAKVRRSSVEPQSSPSKNWNDLSEEIKGIIVKKMDLFTRTRLKVCSKSDKKLVESTPLHLSQLKVNKSDKNGGVWSVRINDTVLRIQHHYFDVCDHSPLTRHLYIKRRFIYSSDLRNIVNSLVRNENVTVDNAEICNWKIYYVDLKMHAKKLKLTNVKLKGEAILNFNTSQLEVVKGRVTVPVVDKLLKKWAEKDYPIGSKFVLKLSSNEVYDWCSLSMKPPMRVSNVPVNSKKYIKVTRICKDYNEWIITSEMCEVPVELPAISSTNWNNLEDKIKRMIVEKMDIFTRTRLKLCSTADKKLVESTALRLQSMQVFEMFVECLKIDNNLVIQVCNNNLLICNEWQRIRCRSNKDARDRLKLIMNSFVENANVSVGDARFLKFPNIFEGKMRMKAKRLTMVDVKWKDETDGVMTNGADQLLRKMIEEDYPVGSQLYIEHTPSIDVPHPMFDVFYDGLVVSPTIEKQLINIQANKYIGLIKSTIVNPNYEKPYEVVAGVVKLLDSQPSDKNGSLTVDTDDKGTPVKALPYHGVNIDDDEMLNIKAKNLTISGGRITKNGINRLLKKMVDEDYPVGSSFRIEDVSRVSEIPSLATGLKIHFSDMYHHWFVLMGSSKVIVINKRQHKFPNFESLANVSAVVTKRYRY